MNKYRLRLGNRGEDLAVQYLEGAGYQTLFRNWRCPAGEIDIVARDGNTLVLVEVRARRGARYGTAGESITRRKKSTLIACGTYLAAALMWDGQWRIDVILIEFPPFPDAPVITLVTNAVEG